LGQEDLVVMKTWRITQKRFWQPFFHLMGGGLAGCWVVALITFSGYVLHFDSAAAGFLFLLVVVTVAILSGFWQATVVSVVAAACLDFFFYPPLLTFSVDDPRDWIALSAFEISALVVSRVSSKEQRSARQAQLQQTAMEQLYELSRSTLLINLHQPPGPQLTNLIQRIFAVEAVAIFDANSSECDKVGAWAGDEQNLARECFFLGTDDQDRTTRTFRRVLRARVDSIGAIAIRGDLGPLVVDALASLTAITLDRCASFENENRIEAAHQSERLRAAVLDSLAHAVKTPLTAIQTANSGLREVGDLNEPQRNLVSLIEEESSQLNALCARLLQTAKLEANELQIGKEEIAVADLVSKVLKEQEGHMADHPVEVEVADPNLKICGDSNLLSMALVQYLDNAAKYSYAQTPVKVAAWGSHAEVFVSVHNYGPAIPISDRERIFQRFYRGDQAKHLAPGTGIGLSTVKMAAEAHHGHVWVISERDEGNTFYLSLPQEIRRPQ
jgi:two-component system, OmpR family, sensor histidine kinase KdpD